MKLNGIPVVTASISLPSRGAWTAKLLLDSTESEAGEATLEPLGIKGTIVRGEAFSDTLSVFVVAGKGGLQKPVEAKGYQAIPAITVARDICASVGEVLDASSDVPGTLAHWGRKESTASEAITSLADAVGKTWRVLPNGNVWMGTDLYVAATSDVLERDEANGTILVGDETPTLLHPISFEGRVVRHIEHEVDDSVRTCLFFGGEDRIRGALERLVKKSLPRLSYLGPTPAKVVSQNADGTLELRSEDPRAPHLSKVRFRYSTPGVAAKVRPGAKCFVFYDSADPSLPSAGLFESGALEEITYTAPTVNIGDSSATFLAHSSETITALEAISSALQAVSTAATIAAIVPGAVTTTSLLGILSALGGVSSAVDAAIETLPTTKAKGT